MSQFKFTCFSSDLGLDYRYLFDCVKEVRRFDFGCLRDLLKLDEGVVRQADVFSKNLGGGGGGGGGAGGVGGKKKNKKISSPQHAALSRPSTSSPCHSSACEL